jgi:hypothetical protein
MSLQGLPDFQRPIHGPTYEIYHPYEHAGSFVVASSRLEVATTVAGKPDFLLEFIRGMAPGLPPGPYVRLDFRVSAAFPAADALAQLRDQYAAATVMPPVFSGGFLRLQPAADTGDLPADLLEPMALAANGLGTVRYAVRLSPAAGAAVEGALEGDVLGIMAWAEMELEGVAPRVPVQVRFSPADVLGELAQLTPDPAAPVITRDRLEQYFAQELHRLPLTLSGALPIGMDTDFIECLADRVRVDYGRFVAARDTPVRSSIGLDMREAVPGSVTWDLGEPIAARRTVVAALDPFEAARRVVTAEGISAVVKQTIVPPLETGTRRVHVTANLPAARSGVISLGVDLVARERPPQRPQAVYQTIEFVPPTDAGVATLKLSMAEPTAYEYATWAVVGSAGHVEKLNRPGVAHEGEALDLGVDDFPVRLVSVAATAALLDLADVAGLCVLTTPGPPIERRFILSRETPELAVAAPRDAEIDTINVEATERGGTKVVRRSLAATQGMRIDVSSFEEFGVHGVIVEADFAGAAPGLIAVDLVPEGREEQADSIETLALTAAVPSREWRYTAASPFRAGYRFRIRAGGDAPPAPWSDVQPAGARVHVSPVAVVSPID